MWSVSTLLENCKRGLPSSFRTATPAFVQILPTDRAQPLAVLAANRVHGPGEKDLLPQHLPQLHTAPRQRIHVFLTHRRFPSQRSPALASRVFGWLA